ncbi:MAG: Putative regulator of the mannose operon, ManO [uncultured Nocardioidaceae bacterium]|uniref:Regulator of the mannose operon, ManO n=1 Tax=uncultured Nocardioidaceae bacterium TaxID=253824 RepID=A0A6J4L155_9ACTN|nr:MAG: Putative regulator of the mannose operon, ManO [uncultured Nocardioidaceae bacterium]
MSSSPFDADPYGTSAPGLTDFDDARLDDEAALAAADPMLRRLAEAGARVRREVLAARETLADLEPRGGTPRALVAAGADARLLRAVLEPWSPVPFVAWPGPGLPGWAGVMDLVVVLAGSSGDDSATSAVAEAVRRGCTLLVASSPHAPIAELAASRDTTFLPVHTDDSLAVAVVTLQVLHSWGLGPDVAGEHVAQALDEEALACSPYVDLARNPAKELAIALADSTPLVWGGSVLAARAARRVVEAMRRVTGRNALAADAEHLLPLIAATPPKDLFADPFATSASTPRPALVVLDDGAEAASLRERRGRLLSAAAAAGVSVHTIRSPETAGWSGMARYAALLARGGWVAAYLAVGHNAHPDLGPA